jgi:nitrogen fixation/metabolism regulation signal transduction histidine kinase
VVLLETAAPLLRSLRQVQWGSVLFVLLFTSLIALLLGWFFAANIRRPLRAIQQGIAALTQGNLKTRLHLRRQDEWHLIEEALNRLSTSLAENAQLQSENLRMGAELDTTRKLQRMLLPSVEELRQITDLDIACIWNRRTKSVAITMMSCSITAWSKSASATSPATASKAACSWS